MLTWTKHRYAGWSAQTDHPPGHYLIQSELRNLVRTWEGRRYFARLVVYRAPAVMLGYHDTLEEAQEACRQHHHTLIADSDTGVGNTIPTPIVTDDVPTTE